MSIKESALNTITALANSDFIRMVTSAGASRKATLQNIAQHIIENYAGSSLAGSNQSVKAAVDGLNSTLASDTNWKSITAHNATVYYKKHNGIVFVTMRGGLKDMTQNAYTVLATLPAGYRPKLEIQFTCNGLGAQTFFFGNVDASGNINIYVTTASTATAYMGFSVSFPAEQ